MTLDEASPKVVTDDFADALKASKLRSDGSYDGPVNYEIVDISVLDLTATAQVSGDAPEVGEIIQISGYPDESRTDYESVQVRVGQSGDEPVLIVSHSTEKSIHLTNGTDVALSGFPINGIANVTISNLLTVEITGDEQVHFSHGDTDFVKLSENDIVRLSGMPDDANSDYSPFAVIQIDVEGEEGIVTHDGSLSQKYFTIFCNKCYWYRRFSIDFEPPLLKFSL